MKRWLLMAMMMLVFPALLWGETGSLSGDFPLLTQRSIFVKGQRLASSEDPRRHDYSDHTYSTTAPTSRPAEEAWTFRGVTITDRGSVAFMDEQMNSGDVQAVQLRVGDAVASGKISAIAFDHLTYDSHGKSVSVALGQNLLGENSQAGTATWTGSGGSSASPGSATTMPSAADVAAETLKLQQRRQQQLGGGH